ncbi:MAG TPA: hypothetical protein VGO63_02050 [Candidatus Paceibacterota bacterium]|jgi:hypothetical protein|nr:hypothetical protein [Candidatus Paceibacterota bacterium]
MKNQKGFSPIIIIIIVVLLGAGAYAVVNRSVLKSFFEKGDIPTGEQFSNTIDSSLNRTEDRNLLGLKNYDSTKQYQAGDTAVNSQAIYQAKILTQDQKEFKLDSTQSVTFRWTPIVPKPKESVTYRLKVWQLMQGQNGTQAMKTNKPIVTKDVDNVAEITVGNIYTGPCKPPYLCDFIWSVEVITKSGTALDLNASSAAQLKTSSQDGSSNTIY